MLLDGSRNAVSFSVALETSIISVQHYFLDSLNNYKIGGLGPGLGFSMVDSLTLGVGIPIISLHVHSTIMKQLDVPSWTTTEIDCSFYI